MPDGFNVHTLVHEYGGGAFIVSGNIIVFSNYKDQRLYKQSIKGDHHRVPITPDYGGPTVCYADGLVDLHLNHYITVREDHRERKKNPSATIVSVELNGGQMKAPEPTILVNGNDFYAFPVWHLMEEGWHRLNGVIQTCHGTKHNFGLATYLKMGRLRNGFALLEMIPIC